MDKAIKQAIIETYKQYGMEQVKSAFRLLKDYGNYDGFTTRENARTNLQMAVDSNCKQREEQNDNSLNGFERLAKTEQGRKFIEKIINEYMSIVLSQTEGDTKLEKVIIGTYKDCNSQNLSGHDIVRNWLINLFFQGKLKFAIQLDSLRHKNKIKFANDIWEEIANKVINDVIKKDKKKENDSGTLEISNARIYPGNMAMLGGAGLQREGTRTIGKCLRATTSIGKVCDNQQDAVLLMKHPQIPTMKMMVVADGMGGEYKGEVASKIVVEEMAEWFNSINADAYFNIKSLQEDLTAAINDISLKIYNKLYPNSGGSTLTCVIIGKDDTLIANVGDSRAYTYKERKLEQVTEDQSMVFAFYKAGQIKEKDDMRFHNYSNIITEYVGKKEKQVTPQYVILPNTYDKIIIMTDGVCDCLSDKQMQTITRHTSVRKLDRELVTAALNTNSKIRRGLIGATNYKKKIIGGKDNASVAVYDRSQEER